MKIKLLLLNLILILFHTKGVGQVETIPQKNQLEFSTGYNFGFLKNLSFAPVVRYDYSGLNHRLKHRRTSQKENLFEIQLEYLSSELKSDIIPALNADYSKIVLNFSYLKQVYNKNRFSLHIGLQSQTNVSSYFKWRVYDFQQKLGIASRFTFQVDEKQSLSSKLTIPFFYMENFDFRRNCLLINIKNTIYIM